MFIFVYVALFYLLGGLIFGLLGVLETGRWDPSDGWFPIWFSWLLILLFWPYWIYKRFF